jgi:hypothetical protein
VAPFLDPPEDAPLDWSTDPWLAIAMFGETFTAAEFAVAVWSIELVAFCDCPIAWVWSAGRPRPGPPA